MKNYLIEKELTNSIINNINLTSPLTVSNTKILRFDIPMNNSSIM
jgi:hypothetical protein